MNAYTKQLVLAVATALAAGMALADGGGGGGDNSMSRWTGESYAAFEQNRVGDFHQAPSMLASSDEPVADETTTVASASMPRWFHDDTAG